jgi:membrane fusion protein, multidrug efflux system
MVKQAKNSNWHLIIGLIIIIISACGIYAYFKYDELYPSTDNAYVNAKLVNVSTKVTGYLQSLSVINNQRVKKGDILFTINPIDYKLAADQSQKNYDSQVSQAEAVKKQIEIQKEQTLKDKAQYKLAKQVESRFKKLFEANTISKQAYENAQNNLVAAKSAVDSNIRKEQQLKNVYQLAIAKKDQAHANLDSAVSNLDYTRYVSPVDGYVTNLKSLTPGEFINAGQQIFGIVDDSHWWIDAHFKETHISRIKPGQPVKIKLDMYDHKYKGVVDSISYASGNTFSLLPAENATGNWVKVTQRFTVRIKLDNEPQYPLRVGASAKVVVKTTTGKD